MTVGYKKTCDLCGFEATSREQFAGHRSSHVRKGDITKKPPRVVPIEHKCKICGKSFETGPILGAHSRVHLTKEQVVFRLTSSTKRFDLKRALIILGREYKCESCGIGPSWNGKDLTLQVDHIDGNNKRHDPDNLRFLCPNCHTQTPTYGNKKRN